MHDCARIDLTVRQGATYGKVLRWGQGVLIYAAITEAVKRAPTRFTVPDHGIPDGWVVRIESVRGLRGLDSTQWHAVHVIDADTVEINDINAAALRGEYAGDGYLVFNKPMDLTGYSARMQVREYVEAEPVLLELTSANDGLVIDVPKAAVAIQIMAEDSETLDWDCGVYDLEMIAPGGEVYVLARGEVRVVGEVTR